MSAKTWEFNAIDTLFFKEARPMEAPGSSELGSVFPPPMRTIAGAIRSHVGESQNVNWKAFQKDKGHSLRDIIGYGDQYANMHFQGVWIHYNGERIYPAPLNLMLKEETGRKQLAFLKVGEKTLCDLGENVRLTCLPEAMKGSISLSNHWLTKQGYEAVLNGSTPELKTIIPLKKLREEESRLGIARDNQKRVVEPNKLYQTKHIRLNQETSISVDIQGLDEHLSSGMLKLGGEGRLANIQSITPAPFLSQASEEGRAKGIVIYLLTPLLLPENSEFLPNFKKQEEKDETVWKGQLKTHQLKLISSVIGKAHREGGWDVAQHKPIPVKSYIPAGSVYHCNVEDAQINDVIRDLHNTQIGEEQHLGRGHIAVGLWLDKTAETKGQTK